jgi:GNAT superfamily N-acetyltransferase
MKNTPERILNAIEDFLMLAPQTPGAVEYLDIQGITGRYSPRVTHPIMNTVTKTMLTQENADETIRTVRDQFADMNKSVGWLVSDSTTPDDMTDRLENEGFVKTSEFAGMILEDLDHSINLNPMVKIRQADNNDSEVVSDLYHRGYPLPLDFTEFFVEFVKLMGGIDYLAYVEDAKEPVAIASLVIHPDKPIMMLGGAATLPEYRGRGLYTSLVAKRLDDGRDKGIQTALIEADRSSSAPIAKKLGFVERCSLDLYAWSPPGE